MKELMTYVAIDTDNVGESIGNAVLSNDTDSISSISENINSGVKVFSQWAEYNGGKIISNGSDEAIFQVPQSSIKDLEELKEAYTKQTGFTISIGLGENVSDAAKALIYAKMNGKDQIMDYSPEMERAMKESISGEVQTLEGDVDDDTDIEDLPQDELEAGIEEEMEAEDEVEETGEEMEEIEVPADELDGDYGSEKMAEGQPEHELDMGEEEEFIHDAQENREDEADDDIIEADEEDDFDYENLDPEDFVVDEDEEYEDEEYEDEEYEDEEYEDEEEIFDMGEDKPSNSKKNILGGSEKIKNDEKKQSFTSQKDIDLDGQPDKSEEHGEIVSEYDLDSDGDVEHEEAMAAVNEEEYSDSEDYSDETEDDGEELLNSIEEELGDPEEVMDEAEAIQEEMEGDDFSDVEGEENLDHEVIKDVIFESLQNFKQNRDYLEAIGQENPQLYQSLISTLAAMIEMAKEFGYGEIEQDMVESDEEMLPEEAMAEEEELSPEDFAVMEEEDIEKNESFIKIMYKMQRIAEMFNNLKKSDEEKSVEEIKEEAKKKLKAKSKKKVIKKKRKASVAKKPTVPGKKTKKKPKASNDGSFCARSHQKMRQSGKDCRSNEDKFSPLCSARRKFNCRGKNEEKNKKIEKAESEKLSKFLKKKDSKLEKRGLPTKRTGTYKNAKEHTPKPHHKEYTQKGNKMKIIDDTTGAAQWKNFSNGIQGLDQNGDPAPAPGPGNRPKPMVKPNKV
jgi:hypothetical protein